ncbi:glycosyltransferase family 1 protein [Stomatohabitans albus]|uniref:glycosyltransferase family 4 protein n=1 Tax=Stomatohabitans albus TaxID=3110766 RepID=UPI00300C09F4
MRVAIVTESFFPTVNGVSNAAGRVTIELERLGHQVLIICPGKGPSTFSSTRVYRVPSAPLPGYSQIPVGIGNAGAWAALSSFNPDVIHLGGPIALGAWGLTAANQLGVPAVAIFQTDMAAFARHYRVGVAERIIWRWLRELHEMAELTLAPSSSTAMKLRRQGFRKVRIWGRGVDLDTFSPMRRSTPFRTSIAPNGDAIVGYVGRLAPEKNVSLLKTLKSVDGIQLLIVGEGPEQQKLQRLLPQAHFLGYQSGQSLAQTYASLDCFIHTGNHETFCQTIQEAQASGVPVIAPAVGGPLDLITHSQTGLLYRPNDRRTLRRHVQWLLDNPGERERMGRAGAKQVQHRSWLALTQELIGHYEDACRMGAGRRHIPDRIAPWETH